MLSVYAIPFLLMFFIHPIFNRSFLGENCALMYCTGEQ